MGKNSFSSMSNTHGFINKDGSIIVQRTEHITVDEIVAVVEAKYEGIVKPSAKLEHERYAYRDGFVVRNCLYKDEEKHSQTGVLWVKASMVFVPYNRTVLVECINEAMVEVVKNGPEYWRNGSLIETVANNAVNRYRSSPYYVETYTKNADTLLKEFNDKYSAPEVAKTVAFEKARSEELRQTSEWVANRIDIDDLPKSTPTRVKDLLWELRNSLLKAIDKYDNHRQTAENHEPY